MPPPPSQLLVQTAQKRIHLSPQSRFLGNPNMMTNTKSSHAAGAGTVRPASTGYHSEWSRHRTSSVNRIQFGALLPQRQTLTRRNSHAVLQYVPDGVARRHAPPARRQSRAARRHSRPACRTRGPACPTTEWEVHLDALRARNCRRARGQRQPLLQFRALDALSA